MIPKNMVSGMVRALILGACIVWCGPAVHAQEKLVQDSAETPAAPALVVPGTTGKPANFANGDVVEAKIAGTTEAGVSTEVDYGQWELDADRAEQALADPTTTDVTMELIRAQLVDWRSALLIAQNANSARIATLRQQISALGAAPAEGETESDEIASRRAALGEQLARLQAPAIAADEAYQRADGLIREIDRLLRERQADALLALLPSPMNPANWPEAVKQVSDAVSGIVTEVQKRWVLPSGRDKLFDNIPAILLLLLLAVALIWRGRRVVDAISTRVTKLTGPRGKRISALVLSLGQIVLPLLGMVALTKALQLTGLLGIVGTTVVDALPGIGLVVFALYWLGWQLFPREGQVLTLTMTPERRAEGRLLTLIYGIVISVDELLDLAIDYQGLTEAARAVLYFPAIVLAGIVLVRIGRLLRPNAGAPSDGTGDEAERFRGGLIALVGRGVGVIGYVGPLLAAFGYVTAADALVFPAANTLVILGFLVVLQGLVTDLYALVTRSDDGARNALVPVLIGFALVLLALPLLALIWGARLSDLTEFWTRLSEGFQIGATRISPTNFLVFAAIFAFGFMVTRLFQGALKGTVLPRTKLDQGARNALVAGVGYIGIFLAALIAINSAGIDLSGLAIVAGALSVGIGFGLQNVVSNFVSGIILLIERPVSEGDWIEVGGVQGTVKSISVRSTRIQTFDRTDVIVPNTDLIAGQVTNWTRYNLSGRLIVPVGVAYGTDTRLVERVLREIAEAQPLAILNPPPAITFMGFGADSMNFEIRMILRDVNFSLSVRTEVNHQIVARFAEAGIEIPFAQSEVTLRNAPDIAEMLRQAMGSLAQPLAATAAAAPARRTPRKASAAASLHPDQERGEGLSTAPDTTDDPADPAPDER